MKRIEQTKPMRRKFSGGNPQEKFWHWFTSNSDVLFAIETGGEAIADELMAHLQKIHPDLTFEMSGVKDGRREFVVSADGHRKAFPAVEQLVSAAPSLDKWTIIAFRQPKSLDFSVRFDEYHLGPDEIWFVDEPDSDRIGLTLYINGLAPENEDQAKGAAFILLDSTLGEYAVETRVGFIEIKSLPNDQNNLELKPFRTLREVIGVRGAG